MARVRKGFGTGVLVWMVGMSTVCMPASGREAQLEIYPQKVPAESGKYSLLPAQASLTEGDAVAWYEKAIAALPAEVDWTRIEEWLKAPAERLPLQEVQGVLERFTESLKCVVRGTRCREGKWPELSQTTAMTNLAQYRRLAFAVRLWAKTEIAQGEYDGAILALQTGFGMARHLGQARTIIQALVGTGIGAVMCQEVEQIMQAKGAPNLYHALSSLPRPFVDMEVRIENEKKASLSGLDRLVAQQLESQLKESYDGARKTTKRFDGQLAALQCVEAIRSYAASHGGQLPGTLADITEVSVPKDPMSGSSFDYTLTDSTAVLESAIPPGGKDSDRTRYEIVIKN